LFFVLVCSTHIPADLNEGYFFYFVGIMCRFYTIIFFILYFKLSISTDQNKSSLRLILNSNLRIDKLNENNNTNNFVRKKAHQQLLNEHLKIIIIIGSISVGIMIIIVSVYIAKQYCANKIRNNPETIDQTIPLNRSKQNENKTRK